MLMPVYHGALHDSRRSEKLQFVIERGLDIFRTDNIQKALYFLCGGWNIKAVCDSGVIKSQWSLNLTSEDFVRKYPASIQIVDLLELLPDEENCYITIKTHEHFSHLDNPEQLFMWVELRDTLHSKARHIQITPENAEENSVQFRAGQEKARKIFEVLTVYGFKQDKDALIRFLQKKPITDLF